jgi:hypothetical protein
MREPEGIENPRPGRSLKTPWSKCRANETMPTNLDQFRELVTALRATAWHPSS